MARRLLSVPSVLVLRHAAANGAELHVLGHENAVLRWQIPDRFRYESASTRTRTPPVLSDRLPLPFPQLKWPTYRNWSVNSTFWQSLLACRPRTPKPLPSRLESGILPKRAEAAA